MEKILEFFGLTTRAKYLQAYSDCMDANRDLHDEQIALLNSERNLAAMILERDLHKRESSAHARTAREARSRLSVLATVVTQSKEGALNGGNHVLVLDISNGNYPYRVPVRSLVRNRKNKTELDAIAKEINDACALGLLAEKGPLLRPASSAPALGAPYGNGSTPKGFA